jgi:glycosyltransferase involved in cell wall biosynthesis
MGLVTVTEDLSASPAPSSCKRATILFVHNKLTRFVAIDRELLSGYYTVVDWSPKGRFVNLLALARAMASSDAVFGWFASWHTLFPCLIARILGKPSVIVVGGYDTAQMPAIRYGNQRGGIRTWITRAVMRSATRLLTNSGYTKDEVISNAHIRPDKVSVVYHGVQPVASTQPIAKKDLVITVGNVDYCNLERKGLEPFVRAAAFLPGIQFAVIGKWLDRSIDHLRNIASRNVQFTGEVSDQELARYYGEASVYVQASSHEGFGLALAEAMLAECAPVVTARGSLPEVVGDSGLYVESVDPKTLARGIAAALDNRAQYGMLARARVEGEFPLAKRSHGLYDLLQPLLVASQEET